MKVYITHDDNKIGGYNTVAVGEIEELSKKFFKSQLDEIYAPKVLNFVSAEKQLPLLNELLSLIKNGGTLLVGGIDATFLLNQVSKFNLSLHSLNTLLFEDTPRLKSLCSLLEIKNHLLGRSKIQDICIDNSECTFTIRVKKE